MKRISCVDSEYTKTYWLHWNIIVVLCLIGFGCVARKHTVLDARFTEVRYSRCVSQRRKNFELNILLITVRWWLSRHKCMSPSCIILNLGPIGLLGVERIGELSGDGNMPSSMLDAREMDSLVWSSPKP